MVVNGQLHAPVPLSLGKEPPVSLAYEAVWAPDMVWTRWRREILPPPARKQTPVIQPLAYSLY